MPDFAVRAEDDNQSHVAFNLIISSRLSVFGLHHVDQFRIAHVADARRPVVTAITMGIRVESVFQTAYHANRFAVIVGRFEFDFFRGDYGLLDQAEGESLINSVDADIPIFFKSYGEFDNSVNPRLPRGLSGKGFFFDQNFGKCGRYFVVYWVHAWFCVSYHDM